MTDIRDNPPPLPEEFWTGDLFTAVRQIEAAAFARGVAAGQAEIDELRVKLKALEEQEAFGWFNKDTKDFIVDLGDAGFKGYEPLYLAAGAKP